MKIGGLQPVTLLDYPQKLAAIVFAAGCNMRCSYCYNFKLVLPELIADDKLYDEDKVIDFLLRRRKYLDGLVISGGEPLVQPDLKRFLKKMKAAGYQIKLDTNGLLADKLEELLAEGLVDYVAMDIKGPLESYQKYCGAPAGRAADSIKLIMESGLPYEFRSTLVKGLHRKEDIAGMAQAIKGAKLYYLQNYSNRGPLAGDKFQGKEFFRRELEEMREVAAQFVESCLIR